MKKEWPICTVVMEVTPEHNIRKGGYSVEVMVDEDKEEIKDATCKGFKAGEGGGCKHVVAGIFWLHRRSEEPSPTETVYLILLYRYLLAAKSLQLELLCKSLPTTHTTGIDKMQAGLQRPSIRPWATLVSAYAN